MPREQETKVIRDPDEPRKIKAFVKLHKQELIRD